MAQNKHAERSHRGKATIDRVAAPFDNRSTSTHHSFELFDLDSMPNWLTKSAVTSAQSYELKCPCGQEINGERRSTFRRVICKECGEPMFVLPNDIYPKPKPKKSRSKKGRGKKSKGVAVSPFAGVGDQFVDVKVKIKQKASASTTKAKQSLKLQAGSLRRVFTPFRLVLIMIFVLVIATIVSVNRGRAMAAAEVEMRQAAEIGFEALKEKDFENAAKHFLNAAKASKVAELDDPYSRLIRQLSFETNALQHLSTETIYDATLEANQYLANGTPKSWKDHFELHYSGDWVVFQGKMKRRAAKQGEEPTEHLFEFEFPLSINDRRVVITTEIEAMSELLSMRNTAEEDAFAGEPAYVIFAAQLDTCQQDGDDWVFTTRPSSSFLWSHYEILLETGMGPDELIPENALRAILSRQTKVQDLADMPSTAVQPDDGGEA